MKVYKSEEDFYSCSKCGRERERVFNCDCWGYSHPDINTPPHHFLKTKIVLKKCILIQLENLGTWPAKLERSDSVE